MKKRLVSILLALCMVLSLLPGVVWATEPTEDENTPMEAKETQLNNLSISGEYNIDDKLDYTVIPNGAVDDSEIIPLASQLTDGIFTYSVKNGEITILGVDSFASNSRINIPAQINGIPVTSIDGLAFSNCRGITGINIPNSVTYIGFYGLYTSQDLCEITVDAQNSHYSTENGILFDKSKSILYVYPQKKSGNHYTIPNSVTQIAPYAFYSCDELTDLIIPDSVDVIGDGAFSYCACLSSIAIPDNVASIGKEAFKDCKNLSSIYLSKNITVLEEDVFSGCENLVSIKLPYSLQTIGAGAFHHCKK